MTKVITVFSYLILILTFPALAHAQMTPTNPVEAMTLEDLQTNQRFPQSGDFIYTDPLYRTQPDFDTNTFSRQLNLYDPITNKLTSVSSPNIIFILTDDQQADTLGIAGNPIIKTPHIDSLATNGGVYFPNTYIPYPICAPSRATILTGKLPHSHGLIMNNLLLPVNQATLPQILQKVGYETAMIGKCHLGNPSSLGFGFSLETPALPYWNLGEAYPVIRQGVTETQTMYHSYFLTTEAIKYLTAVANRQTTTKKPFFLWLAYNAPHESNQPPATPNRYTVDQFSPPTSIADNLSTKPPQQSLQRPHQAFLPSDNPADAKFPWQLGWTKIKDIKEKAYEEISIVDDGIGTIKKHLQSLGVADNTIIVFMSDNGFFFGEHQLYNKAAYLYEEQVKVPLIINYPKKITQSRKSTALVSSIDVTPTLLSLVGVPVPHDMHGQSFASLLTGQNIPFRKSVYLEYYQHSPGVEHYFPMKGLIMDGYKFVHHLWTSDTKKAIDGTSYKPDGYDFELYNLSADPFEMKNLMSRQGVSDSPLQRMRDDPTLGKQIRKMLREMAVWQTDTLDPVARVITNYKFVLNNDGSVTLTWNSPDDLTTEVEYQESNCNSCPTQEKYDWNYTKNHVITLSSLKPNTDYDLRYFSISENGNGVYSVSKITTISAKPGDFNGDGFVTLYDYSTLISGFGTKYTIYDYNTFLVNFGR